MMMERYGDRAVAEDVEDDDITTAPIILVPGFWLGAWAWDEVADSLRSAGTTSPR